MSGRKNMRRTRGTEKESTANSLEEAHGTEAGSAAGTENIMEEKIPSACSADGIFSSISRFGSFRFRSPAAQRRRSLSASAPSGALPGKVIYTGQHTVSAVPDEALAERLLLR